MTGRRALCEEYINRISDLEYKRRKEKREVIILMLLLVFLIEEISNNAFSRFETYYHLFSKESISNPRRYVSKLNKAFDRNGEFVDDLDNFVAEKSKVIQYLEAFEPLTPQDYDNKKMQEMIERTELFEKNANVSLIVNQMLFQKKTKTWNTQRDRKVRKTEFHSGIDGQMVGINELFRVGKFTALYPSHSMLPAYDRYNCRCYLTYR